MATSSKRRTAKPVKKPAAKAPQTTETPPPADGAADTRPGFVRKGKKGWFPVIDLE